MKNIIRATAITSTLIAIVFFATGTALAASDPALRRIVVFKDGISAQVQKDVVTLSGSRFLRALPLINSVSIALPATDPAAALTFLTTHPAVSAVQSDPRFGAHGTVTQGAGGDGAGGDGAGGDGAGGDGAGGDGAGGDGAGGDRVVFLTPTAAPVKEMYPWGIAQIGAADVHRDGAHTTGQGVHVAVFDTGIDPRHPDLAANIIGGMNAIAEADSNDWSDDNGHGTAMAGIIAAPINRVGVIGGAPRAKLYAVKVLDRNGLGHTSDTIFALGELMGRADIRVINMSFGTSLVWPLFQVAVQRATEAGKIIIASRGNAGSVGAAAAQGAGGDGAGGDGAGGDGAGGDGAGGDGAGGDGAGGDAAPTCTSSAQGAGGDGAGGDGAGGDGAGGDGAGGDGAGGDGAGGDAGCGDPVKYPAAYPEVISVGASTITRKVATYSLSGGVDVVAPGGGGAFKVLSTDVGGGYGLIAGTSPAAAHVSAAVALIMHLRPQLSLEQVVTLLQGTANPLSCARCTEAYQGKGEIDVRAIVEELTRRGSSGRAD